MSFDIGPLFVIGVIVVVVGYFVITGLGKKNK